MAHRHAGTAGFGLGNVSAGTGGGGVRRPGRGHGPGARPAATTSPPAAPWMNGPASTTPRRAWTRSAAGAAAKAPARTSQVWRRLAAGWPALAACGGLAAPAAARGLPASAAGNTPAQWSRQSRSPRSMPCDRQFSGEDPGLGEDPGEHDAPDLPQGPKFPRSFEARGLGGTYVLDVLCGRSGRRFADPRSRKAGLPKLLDSVGG